MHLQSEDIIQQPAAIVYPLVRDEMAKIVPFLQNVERIEVIKHTRISEQRVEVVNHWFAQVDIPAMAKKFIRPELLSWKDYALWKDDEYCVDYHLESFLASSLFEAKGTNYFLPEGDQQTRVRVTCDITIYPDRIPGLPGFLAKRIQPTVEDLIRRMLGPNITSLAKGLMGYFASPKA